MPRRLVAIVFTDMVGYTERTQSDESAALRLVQDQEKLIRPLLSRHGGRKVKSTGDGFLLEFENALDAVQFGVELQLKTRERDTPTGTVPLRLRIGVHLGDVQRLGTDILGDAVNLAARIEPLAEPGGICLSEQVFAQVRNKLPYRIESMGIRTLKGIYEPVQVYRVVLAGSEGQPPAPTSEHPRVAVLPLANISPDPGDAYFADGLTEELISALAQVRGLRVISHTSVNQYRGTTKPIAQIGSELGADHVLEGSVRKAGDQLRIMVQLIDTRTDEHRWAQTYDRKFENVFAIQADVAERAAGALKVELLKSEREALRERPTSNLVAYEQYLRGTQALRAFAGVATDQERKDREVIRYLERAIEEDSQFSAAYSALATHLISVAGMARSATEAFSRARELVAKALELNPGSSDAHAARGNLAMQADLDWGGAEREFQEAIALNPSNSMAHCWYGFLLTTLQRHREAKEQDRAAIELDPLWILPWFQLSSLYERVGDGEAHLENAKRMVATFGHLPGVDFGLANAYLLTRHESEAIAIIERYRTARGLVVRAHRAGLLAALGKTQELRKLMSDLEGGRIREYFSPYLKAMGHVTLGEKDRALTILEREEQDGERCLWNFYQSYLFDPIRADPRFVALLRKIRLPTQVDRPLWTPPPKMDT